MNLPKIPKNVKNTFRWLKCLLTGKLCLAWKGTCFRCREEFTSPVGYGPTTQFPGLACQAFYYEKLEEVALIGAYHSKFDGDVMISHDIYVLHEGDLMCDDCVELCLAKGVLVKIDEH